MKTSTLAAVAAAVTIALAGCGGSSNKELSYSGLISKSNELCRDGQAEFAKVQAPDAAAKVLDKYLKKFKDLKPPKELKAPFDEFVSVTEEQVALLRKGDVKGFNRLNARSNEIASRLGAKDCISE
jgi:hypothetical protein